MRRVLALIAVGGCAEPAPVLNEIEAFPVVGAGEAPGSIDELRRRIARVLEEERVPGAAIALVGRDGVIWSGGVGVADRETGEAVDGDTVFRAASITKLVVGMGVMRLVEQGRIQLDRPVVIPGVPIENRWDQPVTLAHALEHTAGFDDMRPNETFVDDDAMGAGEALGINPRSRVVRWRPGTRFAYSNVGYGVAARAIEVATGEPFDAWLKREVMEPVGMRAEFRRMPGMRLASGYAGERRLRFRPIAHRAAGAMLASANDLAALVGYWLRRDESVVSRKGLERIERAETLPYPRTDVEYGLGNGGDVGHPVKGRGHDGGLPGFRTSLRYFPELGVGYVVLLNAEHSPRASVKVRRLAFAYLARDRVIEAGRGEPPEDGYFAFASPRSALFGFVDTTMLGWRVRGNRLEPLIGAPIELVPSGDGGYRLPGQSGTSIRFTTNRDGQPVMIAPAVYAEAGSWWIAKVKLWVVAAALVLVDIAPLWAAVVALVRRRRLVAPGLVVWPALAGASLIAMSRLLLEAREQQIAGELNATTFGVCAASLVFAIAAAGALICAVSWARRPDRPAWWRRVVPSVTAVAAFGLALWFAANHVIGLRTWAW